MHRVHHSVDPRQTSLNVGFNLPWWGRLLGTCVARSAKEHTGMDTEIEKFRAQRDRWIDRMLAQPLRGPANGYALDVAGPAETKTEQAIDSGSDKVNVQSGSVRE